MPESNDELEISVQDVKRLQDQKAKMLLLDVRQPQEYEHVHIEGATLIPLPQLAARLSELEPHRNDPIVIHCHHGGRSMQATMFLRQQGFTNVKNMTGGINAWSMQIDPSKPRY